jgi:protease-4
MPEPDRTFPATAPSASATPAEGQQDRARGGAGWKWFVAIVSVLILSAVSCCGLTVWAVGDLGEPVMTGDAIALIHVDGVIAGTGSAYDGIITPEDMIHQLDEAQSDERVRAVLLRVDSPGGTVAASQEIATEIARFDKPVVVSVGDIGASGAYMIASQCDEIIASPTSAVGSIGVISEIPNVEGLLDKLGVKFTVLTAGEYKDAGSIYRSLTETETQLIQKQVDNAYEEFITIVAEGRDLPEAEVRELATGWVFSGSEALELGLIDDLGTYSDAVDRAAELGGIEGEPAIVTYDTATPFDWVYGLLGVSESLRRLEAVVSPSSVNDSQVPR